MLLTQAETAIVQTNVIEIFTNAGIFADGAASLMRLSNDKHQLLFDWSAQWKPVRDNADKTQIRKMWDWASLAEREKTAREKFGWYMGDKLAALANLKISDSADDWRFKNPSVAIYLFERSPDKTFFKGLARPLFYETARQIGAIKNVQNLTVVGGYEATDQDDFDLFFGMKSDVSDLPLEECHYRIKKCAEPFDWEHLPTYFQMKRERKSGLTPTPSF